MKTRYKEIGPRVNYYFGVFVATLGLVFCAFLCFKIDPELKDGGVRFMVLSVFSLMVMYKFYELTSKCIYGIVDLQSQHFIYGNLFFKQEVSLSDVTLIKKRWFWRYSYLIAVGGKKYILNSSPSVDEVEKYLKKTV